MASTVTTWIAAFCITGAVLAAPPANLDYSGDCTRSGCHDSFSEQPVVHDPIGSCDVCHEVDDEAKHTFELAASGAELCQECHSAFEGKVPHGPAADGECLACHDPHASKHKALLIDGQVELCAGCHDDVTDGRSFLHGPAAAGDCTACHNPHASDHAKLLSDDEKAVCLDCHDAMGDRLADSKHVHSVVEDGCTGCHDPHGAGNRMFTTEVGAPLCLSCHDGIGEAVEEATVKHSAVTAGAGCAGCHDPHASSFAGMLTRKQIDVCLSCHNKPIDTPGGKLSNIKALLAESSVQHGPIADGECVLCHAEVHGGERAELLGGAYPTSFYVGYSEDQYTLCFECHDAEAFASAETDDATQFRNGTQNLHFVHVSREIKGRSCGACHQVHASKQQHLIAEDVAFGQWRLPIGFRPTETGGTCASGCHRVYRYDRENAVTNVPAAEPAAAT